MGDYPAGIDLANALLNLAFAQMGLRQWRRSYEAFEDSMAIFQSVLKDGESPNMNAVDSASIGFLPKKHWNFSDKQTQFFQESTDDETSVEREVLERDTHGIQIDGFDSDMNFTLSNEL